MMVYTIIFGGLWRVWENIIHFTANPEIPPNLPRTIKWLVFTTRCRAHAHWDGPLRMYSSCRDKNSAAASNLKPEASPTLFGWYENYKAVLCAGSEQKVYKGNNRAVCKQVFIHRGVNGGGFVQLMGVCRVSRQLELEWIRRYGRPKCYYAFVRGVVKELIQDVNGEGWTEEDGKDEE